MQYSTGRVQYRPSLYSQCKTTDQETDVCAHKIRSESSISLLVPPPLTHYGMCSQEMGNLIIEAGGEYISLQPL